MTEIKPALTAEEWRSQPKAPDDALALRQIVGHRLAALALYGQLFGFTRADVEAIRAARDFCRSRHMGGHPALDTIGDRIEALLPPETP